MFIIWGFYDDVYNEHPAWKEDASGEGVSHIEDAYIYTIQAVPEIRGIFRSSHFTGGASYEDFSSFHTWF